MTISSEREILDGAKQIMPVLGISSRATLSNWRKKRGCPVEESPTKTLVAYKDDLLRWKMQNCMGLNKIVQD